MSYDVIIKRFYDRIRRISEDYLCDSCFGSIEVLVENLEQAIAHSNGESLLTILSQKLQASMRAQEIPPWFAITNEVLRAMISLDELYKDNDFIKDFIRNLLNLKELYEKRAIAFKEQEIIQFNNSFKELVISLNLSFDMNTIRSYAITLLNISDIYLSLYRIENDYIAGSTNVLSVKGRDYIFPEKEERELGPHQIIPRSVEAYRGRFSLVIMPLSYRKKPLGFLVTDYQKVTGSAYENLQVIISTALNNDSRIQEIKVAEQRFSDIAHSTTNWLWETDSMNCFTYTSTSVQDVLGYLPNEIIGKPINSFTHSEKNTFCEKMRLRENLVDEECWFLHKDKSPTCVFIAGKAIFNEGLFAGYRGAFKDVTEQKFKDNKIQYLAYNDILTDLPNRTFFMEKLDERIAKAKESDSHFALMFIDLNKFKYVNDTYGHAMGDLLLQGISKILKKSTRSSDVVARLGGDEFTILLPKAESEKAVLNVVQRIIAEMEKPHLLNSTEIFASLSIGITMFPHDGEDSDSLLNHADDCMYLAKRQGRNKFVFYDKTLKQRYNKTFLLESLLVNKVEAEDISIYYQPLVNPKDESIMGLEALARITDKNNCLMASGEFIHIAKELGLLNQIDEIVLKKVCEQSQTWEGQKKGGWPISVNLSSSQLLRYDVVQTFMDILNDFGVSPLKICFEIRESILIENESIALENINAFKAKGFKIALDDFGAGTSSLNCINIFPIDSIKLSRVFIFDGIENRKNAILIQGIVDVARALGLNAVALGVETEEQYQLVKTLGFTIVQGFYFYRPLSVDEIDKL